MFLKTVKTPILYKIEGILVYPLYVETTFSLAIDKKYVPVKCNKKPIIANIYIYIYYT